METVLIVANQTIGGRELADAITDRAADRRFHLLVPIPAPPPAAIAVGLAVVESAATALMELPDQRALAEERLAIGLAWLEELGVAATGELCDGDVAPAVRQAVVDQNASEVIVSTLPSRLSRWLKQDLPCRIERAVDVPVTVVTARS